MVKDIFQELRLDVPNIEKHITPNMLCLRDLEVIICKAKRKNHHTGGCHDVCTPIISKQKLKEIHGCTCI